jgi:hypothetical protein
MIPLTDAMTADELVAAMRTILAEEREAIRKLDAPRVLEASGVKEDILRRLQGTPPTERTALRDALAELRGELKRNLVLLAHARAVVRDAIELCGKPTRGRLDAKL